MADIVAGRDIVMKSEGRAERAFCYLADATAGFFTVLLRGEPGQAYNVGDPAALTSIASLAETLAALFPERGLRVRHEVPAEGYLSSPIHRNCPDVAKAAALGWQPETTLQEGFRRTVASFENSERI